MSYIVSTSILGIQTFVTRFDPSAARETRRRTDSSTLGRVPARGNHRRRDRTQTRRVSKTSWRHSLRDVYISDGHAGMIVLCGHWALAHGRGGPALGQPPLASPAAPADGPGPHQHLRLTARRTPLRASAADHARRRTDRRRVGSACAPSIGTSKCPHPAGGCSPAPRRQRASLVSCGTFG